MRILLLIFLFLTSINSFACECSEFNKSNVEEFKDEVDYILIGTVIDQLNPEKTEYLDYSWKKERDAYDIIVKIKKVFKGNIQTDTLYITQFFTGACSRKFSAGKDYIFTGKEIKKFVNQNKKSKIDSIIKNDSIPSMKMTNTPPEYKFEEGVIYDNFKDGTEKWNSLLAKHKMIWTNQCYSFNLDSDLGQLLIK
ncbi:MAG: hypothetical protein ABGW91_04215 [Christiangramia sp.]|tara:strand:+ start:529 stop:1113 length:585 start_codon:yes stop_codon:yes gene_type:complete